MESPQVRRNESPQSRCESRCESPWDLQYLVDFPDIFEFDIKKNESYYKKIMREINIIEKWLKFRREKCEYKMKYNTVSSNYINNVLRCLHTYIHDTIQITDEITRQQGIDDNSDKIWNYRTELCFWKNEPFHDITKCNFAHNIYELRCIYYAYGYDCPYAELCVFRHR